ncbi:DUF3328 domain-containing protein [Pyrenophora tritici-repentis]|nr:DUF3328 domain-containing protein [Pyrenophora tritici-repentis]
MPMPTKQSHFGSYETGFRTELRASQNTFTLHRVKFYGGVLHDENGTVSLSHRPGEPDYFGTPSPDIDLAWTKLISARMIKIEPKDYPEEAVKLSKQDLDPRLEHHTDPLTYRVEASGLHALHCLNYIRKSFWPEYYKGFKDPPENERDPKNLIHSDHLKHCLLQLQQALICQADLTPTPRTWRPAPAGKKGHGLFHADVDQWHTCRNWEAMREWMHPLQEIRL